MCAIDVECVWGPLVPDSRLHDGLPGAGDVLRITRAASVQFIHPMLFRVIRVHDWSTPQGWVWLDGYQLNDATEAVERRSIFVQVAGLETVDQRELPQHPGGRTSSRPVRPQTNADTLDGATEKTHGPAGEPTSRRPRS